MDRTLRSILAALRDGARSGVAAGIAWQTVVDGFGQDLHEVRRALAPADRGRFHRHVRAVWPVHRHRLPPDLGARLDAARAAGSLDILRGHLRSATREGAGTRIVIHDRAGERTLQTAWIVDCTGPADGLARSEDPLIHALFADGTVRSGDLGIGIDVDADGRCIASDGTRHRKVFAVGSMTRMRFGEVTSTPQIRERASHIASIIAESIIAESVDR